MGKQTRQRQAEAQRREERLTEAFAQKSAQLKVPKPLPDVSDALEPYREWVWRPLDGFVSKTKSRHDDKRRLELVRYAFGRYPVPALLDQAWRTPVERQGVLDRGRLNPGPMNAGLSALGLDYRAWYVALATGQSLYKTHTKAHLTKAETHLFITCPHPVSLDEAVVFAIARAAGAPEGDALRLARSRLAEQPLTEFWKDAIRFFARPEATPASVNATNDLLDYLREQHTERPGFRLMGSGLTGASLTKRMHDWHHALRRLKILGSARWEGHALPDYQYEQHEHDRLKMVWRITQIKDTKTLAAEGTAMRHCVLSYKATCISGASSIWSVTSQAVGELEPRRRLTIELRNTGKVVQIRGLANRLARPEERHAVRQWVQAFDLDAGPHL